MAPRFSADDYYDPEGDDGEDEWDYDDAPVAAKKPGKAAAKAVGGSKLGSALAAGRGKSVSVAAASASRFPVAPPVAPCVPRFAFDTASPDDAVRAAQTGRLPGLGRPAPAPASSPPRAAESAFASLSLTASPPGGPGAHPASPLARPSFAAYTPEAWEALPPGAPLPPLHVVALGHVDAGKSSALGRLLCTCGATSAQQQHAAVRAAAQAGAASSAWAWCLDSSPEERQRGVTCNVALAHLRAPGTGQPLVLLDAPGHRDFVPQALEAASRADCALLFVDSCVGAFEAGLPGAAAAPSTVAAHGGGQTVEHAALARAAGCSSLLVVVNKLDAVGWSQQRFQEVQRALQGPLRAVGWRDAAVLWLPCAGREGVNLEQRVEAPHPLAAWWIGGHCVLSAALAQPRSAASSHSGPLRLPVWELLAADAAGARGSAHVLGGCAFGGRLESGAIRPGMHVCLSPSGQLATVKALQVGGESVSVARCGDAVEVGLTGLTDPHTALLPGSCLCPAAHPAPAAHRLSLRVSVLAPRVPLLRGSTVTLHLGAAREPATVVALGAQLEPRTGELIRARPRCLAKGTSGLIDVVLSRPVAAECYDHCRGLGRVALREGGATLALGVVTRVWTREEADADESLAKQLTSV